MLNLPNELISLTLAYVSVKGALLFRQTSQRLRLLVYEYYSMKFNTYIRIYDKMLVTRTYITKQTHPIHHKTDTS